MQQFVQSVLACGLFLLASVAGIVLHRHIPERHRDRDTLDFVRLVIGALVTFLAIVLGLVTASSSRTSPRCPTTIAISPRRQCNSIPCCGRSVRRPGPSAPICAPTWPQ